MSKRDTITQKRRHYFFLNPYQDAAFTKCPKCLSKTKIRKFPLVIHIDPQQLFLLNKKCRYCTRCDLIIARKSELESLMAAAFEQLNPQIIGNNYLVMGVAERSDWRESNKGRMSQGQTIERILVFKDVWNFEPVRCGWYPEPENQVPKP
ncbi:MAG: hypothetical protein ISS79_14085 [Phycisphaerae bacterium]|nr:hypothetical protein [Phycisphaerae bacterium]